jgi:hypothetical protein
MRLAKSTSGWIALADRPFRRLFKLVGENDLEGIVAKRRADSDMASRTTSWRIMDRSYSQKDGWSELFATLVKAQYGQARRCGPELDINPTATAGRWLRERGSLDQCRGEIGDLKCKARHRDDAGDERHRCPQESEESPDEDERHTPSLGQSKTPAQQSRIARQRPHRCDLAAVAACQLVCELQTHQHPPRGMTTKIRSQRLQKGRQPRTTLQLRGRSGRRTQKIREGRV